MSYVEIINNDAETVIAKVATGTRPATVCHSVQPGGHRVNAKLFII
jgi:hypothetical protein